MSARLFDPDARVTDPDTSHQAARDARRGAATLRARCLTALQHAGADGLTDFALAAAVGSQQTSAGKRRLELQRQGLVVDSGERRPSPSGSAAIVWRAVEVYPLAPWSPEIENLTKGA